MLSQTSPSSIGIIVTILSRTVFRLWQKHPRPPYRPTERLATSYEIRSATVETRNTGRVDRDENLLAP